MALRLCSLQLLKGSLGFPRRLFSLTAPASQAGNQAVSVLYTPEHNAIRESLRKIIDTEINPYVDQWEKEEQFPAHHLFKILGQAGMLGVNKPTGIKTKAVKKGDDYVINGSKMWITNGCQADWMCLLTNTSDGPPHKNKSLICLPMKTPGVHVTKKIDKMGMKSSDTAQIFFEDVRVPCKHLIGEEGMGFIYQMLQFQEERMWGVANVLTPMENLIEETVKYTSERKIFNQPLLNNQIVHFRLAELSTEVELLRSLLYRTIGLYIDGNDVTRLASMAKLKAGRLARELSDSCLQFWGGMGFTNEVHISRFYRDSRLLSIGAGADEVMLAVICKYMGTLPSKK
ncbi:probable acyl-CoA dehydrogenase 6 isoform X2 [Phyllobates terribilis]|uniref:probable acyl-CoA dehydrogenase 6 isoform X2 n=1 Tax=Phyllobates terribilis TaxID=111132 RepID=UPI003CCAAB15